MSLKLRQEFIDEFGSEYPNKQDQHSFYLPENNDGESVWEWIEKNCLGSSKDHKRIVDFLLKEMPEEIGNGNYKEGESCADVVIRLLSKMKNNKKKIECYFPKRALDATPFEHLG